MLNRPTSFFFILKRTNGEVIDEAFLESIVSEIKVNGNTVQQFPNFQSTISVSAEGTEKNVQIFFYEGTLRFTLKVGWDDEANDEEGWPDIKGNVIVTFVFKSGGSSHSYILSILDIVGG